MKNRLSTLDSQRPVILDCTIRDGNYAIDFKFTESDTSRIVEELVRLGFDWIEIGHGLGLGAVESGKPRMPANDLEMIQAAKLVAGEARVGAFFIPGMGTSDHLKAAADAGLDFIRIGYDVTKIEAALPFVTEARQLGLIACLNMMKSYAVTPNEFATKARQSEEAGADVVYFVDSAGCMLPDDLAEYFERASEKVQCELGFHGHNNLMLAIPNCLAAYQHGARFLDTSLAGMGRSAGNAVTEILVAVMHRMNIDTGIDLFDLMDMIEQTIWPLVKKTRPHDMMGVTAGYSGFHSSFLPQVERVASAHDVELRRLVAKVALHDPVSVDVAYLETAAAELAQCLPSKPSECVVHSLVDFAAPSLSRKRISNTMHSVDALLKGIEVATAKRPGAVSVLHLVPSTAPIAELVIPEFVLEEDDVVMGRVTYGDIDSLETVLRRASGRTEVFLFSQQDGWAANALEVSQSCIRRGCTRLVRDQAVRGTFLKELLDRSAERIGSRALLIYKPDDSMVEACRDDLPFDAVFAYGYRPQKDHRIANEIVILNDWRDWSDLRLRFDVVICGASPDATDAGILSSSLEDQGRILDFSPIPNLQMRTMGSVINVDMNQAFIGFVQRLFATEKTLLPTAA